MLIQIYHNVIARLHISIVYLENKNETSNVNYTANADYSYRLTYFRIHANFPRYFGIIVIKRGHLNVILINILPLRLVWKLANVC